MVNQTRLCVEMLCSERGFVPDKSKPSSLYKVVDDNHALLAEVSAAALTSDPNLPVNHDLLLAIARRDINERFVAWAGPVHTVGRDSWIRTTVRAAEELGVPAGEGFWWDATQSFDDYRDEVLGLIDQLDAMANLPHIEKMMYQPGKHEYAFHRAINDALNGDHRDAEQWAVRRDSALARPEGHKARLRMERFEQAIQAFRMENPNGIER